jgi:hypothetical protein
MIKECGCCPAFGAEAAAVGRKFLPWFKSRRPVSGHHR